MALTRGGVGVFLKWQQFLSVFLLLSLCASLVLSKVQVAAAFEEAVPVPVPTLSDYFNGETETQKSGVFDEETSLPYDTSHLEYQQQQELQQMQQQLQGQVELQQQMHQQLQQQQKIWRRKQQEGQQKQQFTLKQQTVEGAAVYEQGVHAEGVSVNREHQLRQQESPGLAQGGSERRPVLKGHGYFLLGVVMLCLCVYVVIADPERWSSSDSLQTSQLKKMAAGDLVRSLFLVAMVYAMLYFFLVGGVRLARTLPAYLRWAMLNDEFSFFKIVAVILCVTFFLLGPWGARRQT
ncbi:hypothetical protein Emed_003026 [Eimeria media]